MRVRRKITLRELQSLIGLLSFACCVVQPGRTFLCKLIYRTKSIQQPHFHIRLNKESRLDIERLFLIFKTLSRGSLDSIAMVSNSISRNVIVVWA
jgi:hypothetical protein